MYFHTHTDTRTRIYIYIYIYRSRFRNYLSDDMVGWCVNVLRHINFCGLFKAKSDLWFVSESFVGNFIFKQFVWDHFFWHTVTWFSVFRSNPNNSIYSQSFVRTQINGFKCVFTTLRTVTRSIFKRSLKFWDSVFSFLIGCLTKAEEPSLPYYFTHSRRRVREFIPFSRVLALCEIQSNLSRIWTRVTGR